MSQQKLYKLVIGELATVTNKLEQILKHVLQKYKELKFLEFTEFCLDHSA